MTINDLKRKIAAGEKVVFTVKVIPRRPQSAYAGEMADGAMKISLKAAPEKGRANQELLDFLAALLKPYKLKIKIISGRAGRRKIIEILPR